MKRSLSSVLIVVGSLFVAFSVTWIYLRGKAGDKPVKTPFEHAFTQTAHLGGKKIILVRMAKPDDGKIWPKSETYNVGAWLDVRLGGENQLVVSPAELLGAGELKGKPIEISSRADCKSAGLFELEDFAEILRDKPVVLNLISRRPGLSNKILEIWGPGKMFSIDAVLMQSEIDGTLKELREAQPRGLYGSSQATLIQMEVLSNLGLDGLMDLKADALVSAIEELERGVYHPRVREATLKEAHRRGLKRYAGPTRTKEAAQELLTLGYDGVLVERREILEAL